MIRTWALFAVLISGALIDVARGSDRVECEPQRVTGDGHYWAYRIIDGRECWYPGRPGKPKNELYWGRGTTPSARQTVDQPEAETVPSEPPSRLVAAPPEKPEIAEAMPAEWRATTADQLLAFTCCWPELEKPALLPQPTLKGGEPPAWPLALLPLALYPLWWIAKPRRGLRAVRAGDAGRVATRRRLHRHDGRDSAEKFRQLGWCENGEAPVETTNSCRPAADAAPASMRAPQACSFSPLTNNNTSHSRASSMHLTQCLDPASAVGWLPGELPGQSIHEHMTVETGAPR